MGKFKSCIFIMADGARADVFEHLLAEGKLPNIAKYIVERGSYKNGVSVFPSTTGPAYAPYLMGMFPGRCNIPGIRWFDRAVYSDKLFSFDRFRSYIGPETYLMNSDLSEKPETLFEIFPESVSILNELSRGISAGGDKTRFIKMYYKLKSHFTERSNEVDRAARELLLKSIKENPTFIYAVFLGIDTYSHQNHPFHKKVIDSYIGIDESVGALGNVLEKERRLDETLLIIGSDHGLTPTHSHFSSVEFMKKRGYKTLYYPRFFLHFTNADSANMISGNAMTHIYVKSPEGWNRPSTFEELEHLVDEFLERDGVDLVAGISESGRVRIRSQRGDAVTWIDEKGSLRYESTTGDPFDYNGMHSVMDPREALEQSFYTNYPDAILQIIQLFDSPRTGDLVLSANAGFDLRAKHEKPEHRSSHGALLREHMIVPIAFSEKIEREFIRTADIYPTILRLLGKPVPDRIDGISLVD